MPILDPILQYELACNKQKNDPKSKFSFWNYYLNVASKYIFQSSETIKTYLQFKKDLQQNIPLLKEYFHLDVDDDFKKLKIPDFYKFIYDLLKGNDNNQELEGDYFQIKSVNSNYSYFQPLIDNSSQHSWYLCNSPIAILVLKANKGKE